ncbi:hypothetical protein BV22DRAFT_1196940 [Leucogyrophana mollusca]|uniref:Uncharacterized protein n=1 Tax=Leucogyrophana mollusca TaxID=85980 RepID=A0ACB8BBP4_9AGAM|nr:hypothetical protein BV22DRAFT_1196940 [Leucogyrophana mollusca]
MSLTESLDQIQALNYLQMASAAATMYDQVLNFSQEVSSPYLIPGKRAQA